MATLHAASGEKHADLAALFRAGLDGDSASYNRFLHGITPILRRVVGRKLPIADVEDTVQEILISIHKARHTYDGARPLMPWIYAIAQFRITDALRKAYAGSRNECVDIDDLAEVLADVTEQGDATESVEGMLQHVAKREQKILTMMHVEGYTAKETGDRLGMKESAVKVAAHRAIKRIREKLGGS